MIVPPYVTHHRIFGAPNICARPNGVVMTTRGYCCPAFCGSVLREIWQPRRWIHLTSCISMDCRVTAFASPIWHCPVKCRQQQHKPYLRNLCRKLWSAARWRSAANDRRPRRARVRRNRARQIPDRPRQLPTKCRAQGWRVCNPRITPLPIPNLRQPRSRIRSLRASPLTVPNLRKQGWRIRILRNMPLPFPRRERCGTR